MLVRWDANVTALTLSTSGPGLQRDDVEARQTADATLTGLGGPGTRTMTTTGLKATLQAWANGAPNNGWALWQSSSNSWTVRSSEYSSVSYRPRLTVTYQAPVATSPISGAGVTVAVVDSGIEQSGGAGSHQDQPRLHDRQRQPAAIAPITTATAMAPTWPA